MLPIVPEHIRKGTGASDDLASFYLPFIQGTCKGYGITSPKSIAAFLATVGHESSGLKRMEENLNYSAAGLANTWPKRFALKHSSGSYQEDSSGLFIPNKEALRLSRNPQAIANTVYANRMGNGSFDSGDGWTYRGRGGIQCTGKNNYSLFSEAIGEDFVKSPDNLKLPVNAMLVSGWFWNSNGLNRLSDSLPEGKIPESAFIPITERVNGGRLGLKHRTSLYNSIILDLQHDLV